MLRAMRAEKSVGSASASSSALVCSDWVWPCVAAIASISSGEDPQGVIAEALRRSDELHQRGERSFTIVDSRTPSLPHEPDRSTRDLDSSRFVLLAQPIVELATNEISHLELFLRFRDADDHLVPAASFIDVAERHGRVSRIDRWVVEHAVALAVASVA